MATSAKLIFSWGIVMLLGALFMLLMPHAMLNIINLPLSANPVVRLAAVMLLALATYYITMSLIPEAKSLWKMTVIVRILAFPLVSIFVFLGHIPSITLIFLGADAVSGIFTGFAIKNDFN